MTLKITFLGFFKPFSQHRQQLYIKCIIHDGATQKVKKLRKYIKIQKTLHNLPPTTISLSQPFYHPTAGNRAMIRALWRGSL